MHIVKRYDTTLWTHVLVRLVAVLLSLLVCGVVIFAITGTNPLSVYAGIVDGAMGTERRTWITLRDTAILLCIGFAVTPAFRMRFWNVGAEGQVLVGAMASAAVMIYGITLPPWLMYTMCPLAGLLAGAIWGVIPAIFKAFWNTNETLFTLMLNYIAIQLISYAIVFWENPKGSNHVGLINSNTKLGWLPAIGGNKYLIPILVALFLAVGLYIYIRYTKHGYEISVVGESENTAYYAGIRVPWVLIRTMALCGALGGLTGYLLTCDVGHTISTGLAGGRGFTAIVVAWLGKLNPFGMMLVSFFLVFMEKGSVQIATQYGLNESASEIVTGIVLFFILGCEFFIQYKVAFRHQTKEALKA